MLAEQSLREGNLEASLAQLQDEVRRDPANAKSRTFLFQLFAVVGQWERARTQLDVVGELDAGALAMVHAYRAVLSCEALRAEVFAGKRSPLVLGRPQPWLALLIEALRLTAQREHGAAADLRAQAFEAAPASSGVLDGTPFAWIADADSRLGPTLELLVDGRYCWVPFQHIREIRLEDPADLRDLVWLPAQLTWSNGGQSVGMIPSRYPGSESSTDGLVRLARKTEWREVFGEYLGLGQRMLATDAGEHALLDVREVRIEGAGEGTEEKDTPDG